MMSGEETKPVKITLNFGGIIEHQVNAPMLLYQKSKVFVFVSNIEDLGQYLEDVSGLEFHFEVAKNCNYFYRFWLEPRKIN